jgi:hypothetical protein
MSNYYPLYTSGTLRFPNVVTVSNNPFGLVRGPYGQLYQAPFFNDNAARNRLFRDLLGEDDQFQRVLINSYAYPYNFYGYNPFFRPVVFGSNGTASLGGGVYLSSGM